MLERLDDGLQNRYSSVRIRLPPPSRSRRLVSYLINSQAFFLDQGRGCSVWKCGLRLVLVSEWQTAQFTVRFDCVIFFHKVESISPY